MCEFRDLPKRSISLTELTVSKTAQLISKNHTPHIQKPLPVSLSNDILKSLKSQSSLNSTTLSLLNNEKFIITEADMSLCKVSLRSLSILFKHKLRFLSLRNTKVEESENNGDNDRVNLLETIPLLSPTLVYLNTSCFQYSNWFTELIKEGKFPHLEYLSIYCAPNDDDTSLRAILKGRLNLQFLELSRDEYFRDISFLEEVPNLETLSLKFVRNSTMDERKMAIVLRKLSKLRSVNLEMDEMLNVFGEAFRNNSDPLWPQLQSIDLSFSVGKIGLFEEQAIIEEIIKRHTNLEYIDLSNNHTWDLSPSFPTSVKIANDANMKNLINSLRMPRSPSSVFFSSIQSFDLIADRIRDHYNELSTDDLNEILRSFERTVNIIPPWEESVRENASTIMQVICSKNIFRLEPQLLSRCLTAINSHYTSNLPKLRNLVKIKDLLDYCVLDYEDYCRSAFKYSLDHINEPCVARSEILTMLVPKLTLITMNCLMNDIHYAISRLTNIFGQENMDNKYVAKAENMMAIIVAFTGHSKEVCVWLSTRYPLQRMLCLLLRKSKSYSTKIIECFVQILNNMTASINRISSHIRGELITALVSTISKDRLESLITRGIKEYDGDMFDKAIWSMICSLNQSSNILADRLTIAAAKSPSNIADDADDADDFDMDSDDDELDDFDSDGETDDGSDDFDMDSDDDDVDDSDENEC